VLVSLIAQSYDSGMDPEYQRVRFVQRMLIASVLHIVIVIVLAPGLSFGVISLIEGESDALLLRIIAFPLTVLAGAFFAYPFGVPLALVSVLLYAPVRVVLRQSAFAHAAAWMIVGALVCNHIAGTHGETGFSNAIALIAGGIAGIVIGLLVWAIWRTVDVPAQSTLLPP
jgi:hypothetical protein